MKKSFDKCMAIRENVRNIIKEIFRSELKCHKKYLKDETQFNRKESFQCFYMPVILFDSVYRKDWNYYLKVLLEELIHTFSWRNIGNFGFWGFGRAS